MDKSGVARSVSVSDGRMAIEGLSTRYVQDAARRFRLSASGLRFVGGFESRDGRLEESRRFLAEATVTDGALRRAGFEGEAGTIGLTLRPLSQAGEQPRLLLILGYRDEDGAARPFAEAFLAPTVFEALEADMLAGLAQELSISATTTSGSARRIAGAGQGKGSTGISASMPMAAPPSLRAASSRPSNGGRARFRLQWRQHRHSRRPRPSLTRPRKTGMKAAPMNCAASTGASVCSC